MKAEVGNDPLLLQILCVLRKGNVALFIGEHAPDERSRVLSGKGLSAVSFEIRNRLIGIKNIIEENALRGDQNDKIKIGL